MIVRAQKSLDLRKQLLNMIRKPIRLLIEQKRVECKY